MRRAAAIACLAASAAVCASVQAAEPQCTVEHLMQAAIGMDPGIDALLSRVEAAQSNVDQVEAQQGIQANSRVGLDHRYARDSGRNSVTSNTGLDGSLQLQASYDLDLHDIGGLRLRVAELQAEEARLQLRQAQEDTAYEVAEAYLNAYHAQKQIELQREFVASIDSQLAQTRQALAASQVGSEDVALLQRERALASSQLQALERDYRNAYDTLVALAALDGSCARLAPPDLLLAELPGREDAIDEALSQSTAVQIAQVRSRLAETSWQIAKKERLSLVELNSQIVLSRFGDSSDKDFSIGLAISTPQYDGGAGRARASSLRHERLASQLDVQSVRRTVARQIGQAWDSHSSAREIAGTLAEAVSFAESKAAITAERIKSRQLPAIERERDRQTVLRLRIDAVSNLRQADLAVLQLLYASGALPGLYGELGDAEKP